MRLQGIRQFVFPSNRFFFKDAHGRSYEIFDEARSRTCPRGFDRSLHSDLRTARRSVDRRRMLVLRATFVVIMVTICMANVFLDQVCRPLNLGVVIQGGLRGLSLLPVILGFIWLSRSSARLQLMAMIDTLLRQRRCPRCGYDLRELPVSDPDGCIICPECGGAWRLPESGSGRGDDTAPSPG